MTYFVNEVVPRSLFSTVCCFRARRRITAKGCTPKPSSTPIVASKQGLFSYVFKQSTASQTYTENDTKMVPSESVARFMYPELCLSEDEKRCVQIHFRETLLAQNAEVFHRSLLMATENSRKMDVTLGCEKFCYRDLTKWPKLHSICEAQRIFYERLIYEMGLNSEECFGAIYALGRTHFSYAKLGMKPHFLDLWQKYFEVYTQKCKFDDDATKQQFYSAMRKINTFVSTVMNIAYMKAQQESYIASRKS